MTTLDLTASFKAYDVRGIVGETINEEAVRAIGAAFVDVLGLSGETVLVGGAIVAVGASVGVGVAVGRAISVRVN